MQCPYCFKTTPAKLDTKGVYWTHCVPCGMKGKGVSASTTTEDTPAPAKKSRKKKSKPTQVDNVEDALFSEVKPD